MIFPLHADPISTWENWLDDVACFGRPCHPDLPQELRFLAKCEDRTIAALSARGLVAILRRRGVVK